MDFLGLPPSKLLPTFGAAAAVVVALYLLKLRRRRVWVPFSKLWERVLSERPTSSLFDTLKRIFSLLVQLLVVALLVGALGDPRLRGAARAERSIVLLLDGSASMKATDVTGSRARAARDEARRIVQGLGADDRVLIAQMDAEVTALTPMTDDLTTLSGALDSYAPRDTGADLARALRFSLDALRGSARSEVIVIGDGGYDPPRDAAGEVHLGGTALRFVSVGRSCRNVGITAFAVRRYPLDKSRYEVLAEVRNYGDRAERVELSLRADGAPLELTRLTIDPGATVQRVLADQSGANASLEARVTLEAGVRDEFPVDDRAYATLPERRRAKVLLVTQGNRYLEAALLLDEYLDVHEATRAEAPARLRAERFDAVILDRVTLDVPVGVSTLWLRPEGDGSPLPHDPGYVLAQPGAPLGVDQVDRRHPIARFVNDFEEAHIGRVVRYRPMPGDRVVASGNGVPMVIAGERHGDRFVVVAFDAAESDVPLLVAWPVLLINTLDWFSGEDPAYLSSFRTGNIWRVPAPADQQRSTIEAPSGRRFTAPVFEGHTVFFGAEAGLYRVHARDAHTLVAGNLGDVREGQCRPERTLTVSGLRATAPVAGPVGVRRELWVYALLAVLAIIAIEWATWHRRVTV